ncbi:hypothetical protein HPP92_018032 [Vanilla planifolia]|uniref:pyridoxal 5'-phosphate synthase (glutamine hydrolyzing) n=1 Tax=Vanilla planifolia TaxID=51239 RepID=A0A835QEU3_VANPL|nr:hypothetical protein HPP92_018032 [Vanilla planifolia]
MGEIRALRNMDDDEVFSFAKRIAAPYDLVMQAKQLGRLPVVNFAAGGVATPADAALMMQLGCDGVFVGSGIFRVATLRAGQGLSAKRLPTTPTRRSSQRSVPVWGAMVGINLNDTKVERFAARSE